jgi:hypothetical protein
MGLMALTGRRPAEIFFSASFSLPPKKLPYPALIFDGQLKTRQAPGTSFEPYQSPAIDDPGDEIGRRFAYQWSYAAIMAYGALDENSPAGYK